MQMIAYALARLSEPSSYAGLGALLAIAGFHLSDTDLGQLAQLLAAGCGLAALILKERGVLQMTALAALVGAALGTTLGACAPLAGAGAPMGTPGAGPAAANRAAEAGDTTLQTACAEYERARGVAETMIAGGLVAAGAAAQVRSIEHYGDAACANPPPDGQTTGDALSTAIWLGTLVGQIATLTRVSPAT